MLLSQPLRLTRKALSVPCSWQLHMDVILRNLNRLLQTSLRSSRRLLCASRCTSWYNRRNVAIHLCFTRKMEGPLSGFALRRAH